MRAPVWIEVALWYWGHADDHPRVAEGIFPMYERIVREMVDAGLLREGDEEVAYIATDAMRVYVEALGSVPLPVQKWVMPE